jgi:hypothetical protein
MEKEASDRDQTAYACSAQNPKMLPKKTGPSDTKQKLVNQVSAFEAAYQAQQKEEVSSSTPRTPSTRG